MAKITLFVRFAKRNPNHDACNRQLAAAVAGRQHSAFSSCWQLLLTFRGGKKLVDMIPPLITGFLTLSTCVAYNPRHATLRPEPAWKCTGNKQKRPCLSFLQAHVHIFARVCSVHCSTGRLALGSPGCLFVVRHHAQNTTLWCFRPYKPYIFWKL